MSRGGEAPPREKKHVINCMNRSSGGTKQIKFLKSMDGSETFSQPQVIAATEVNRSIARRS